ncbi:urease accessory protein UreE [Roseobacter sp. YSTF-M11]|uniref:Urease accessory protein UreE n=1 Tax=Roseobacter insulae TaxID=2859783 RepID=A0A9X1FXB8_9RHOB|nr:urease accessory protein UreE [Roseobacter insulae]MBW4708977.1 urease accessory protein UreE [Roseobacter insulae]
MLPTAHKIVPECQRASDHVTLDYDARFLRRKVLTTATGTQVLVDLPKTTSLADGDALETTGGILIGIRAAPEPLLQITGKDLHRIAWHIGNRHAPCQIEQDRLLIQRDHVMAQMLTQLGADIREVVEPFTPEGGAYGHGRTHGHDHDAQHGPSPAHGHTHDH